MSEGIKAVDDWIRSPLVASHVPLDAEPRFDKGNCRNALSTKEERTSTAP